MGRKHPDTANPPPEPYMGLTLRDIRARGWAMRAVCGRCGTRLEVDVGVLIRLLGPQADLWGRHPRCRAFPWDLEYRCTGRVTFELRSTPHGSPRRMVDDAMVRMVRQMMVEMRDRRAKDACDRF